MKAPNIYQYRRHGNHLKKMALDQAMARVAIAELVELGFVVTRFRLGACASITVQAPSIPSTSLRTGKGENPVPLQFVPMGFGFNGAFRYTTYAAAFGDWTVEWHKRLYTIKPRRDGAYLVCTADAINRDSTTELRVRHHG